ncbi:MAG: heparinase II/III family protein [Opitutaceae bacterium]|nr:heparinase II/III family protein [Opitutaceae bacterium]
MLPGRAAEPLKPGAESAPFPTAAIDRIPATSHPVVACTPEELQRLKHAYTDGGAGRAAVAAVIEAASKRIGRPVEFPSRGGQHNQWYQCNACQIGLKTVSSARHECPKCKTVYTGSPYDDVLFSATHGRNLSDLADAAWAYALTGEEKYARFAREVLLGYAQRYKSYPYHDSRLNTGTGASRSGGHLFEQTLNEASALAGNIAPAYDLARSSRSFTREDHEMIRGGLLRPMLENMAKHKAGKSNWQSWHNAAMVWGGAVLGDADWVRRAIHDPENGFLHQMQISVSDEGMWYENSWGYHFYTLSALVKTAEAARRLGIDVWSHPTLRKMFLLPVGYAMPDGSLPRYGDDSGTSIDRVAGMLEYAYNAYRDDAMAPLLPKSANWNSVMFGRATGGRATLPAPQGSALFPSAGHAILRSPGGAGLVAALTFGPYGGGHGHYDKLSFVLFGHGRELGVDPGRARSQAYRLPIHQHWYKATISHNAVVIDRAPQKPATGKLESYGATAAWSAVVARCDDAYPGVAQRRLLAVTPSYVLVFDELDSSVARRFDWLYHGRGSAVTCDAAREKEPAGKEYPGWNYVQNVRWGPTNESVQIHFRDGDVTTGLTLAGADGTEVRTGDGVGASIVDRIPLTMVTRRSTSARFAAVIEPVKASHAPDAATINVEQMTDRARITVERAGGRDVFVLNSAGALEVVSNGKPVLRTTVSVPATRAR